LLIAASSTTPKYIEYSVCYFGGLRPNWENLQLNGLKRHFCFVAIEEEEERERTFYVL